MKPSIITQYSDLINSFKYAMLAAYSNFTVKITTELKESNDKRHIEFNKQRLELAAAYIECMVDFFEPTTEEDNNFFTNEEFYVVINHLNRMFGTVYWINLN